jgi:hypothetical protein
MTSAFAGDIPIPEKIRIPEYKLINTNAGNIGSQYLKLYNGIPARGTSNVYTNDTRIDKFGNRSSFASYN